MVARVDAVLREGLEIEDGLADSRVYVLDPCCGTGTYLVEVLRRVAAILLLGLSLGKNYDAAKISSHPWAKEISAG
jgi:predicted helicase